MPEAEDTSASHGTVKLEHGWTLRNAKLSTPSVRYGGTAAPSGHEIFRRVSG